MFEKKQEGSILILTMLVLVGALSIAVAMSSIAVVERKMSIKSKKSVTAFQEANSGIEWALKKINEAGNDSSGDIAINTVFSAMGPDGKISCPSATATCEIYLLKKGATRREIIDDATTSMEDIVAIRSTGMHGTGDEQVGRALEVYAMPNCGTTQDRKLDLCMDKNPGTNISWGAAVTTCSASGARLCTVAELMGASEEGWAGDVVNDSGTIKGVYIDGENLNIDDDNDHLYKCCRNR